MDNLAALRKWRANDVKALQDAKYKAAQCVQLGQPERAQRWLEQHGQPAAANIDYINSRLKAMGETPNG